MRQIIIVSMLTMLLTACATHYRVPKPQTMPNPTIWGPASPRVTP